MSSGGFYEGQMVPKRSFSELDVLSVLFASVAPSRGQHTMKYSLRAATHAEVTVAVGWGDTGLQPGTQTPAKRQLTK